MVFVLRFTKILRLCAPDTAAVISLISVSLPYLRVHDPVYDICQHISHEDKER